MTSSLKIVCLGDVVGRPGRVALQRSMPRIKEELRPDVIIVNGENAAGGVGITPEIIAELTQMGVSMITSGDHVWKHKEIVSALEKGSTNCMRAANYPEGTPGPGFIKKELASGVKIGVFNLLGRVFTGALVDCPFRTGKRLLADPLADCRVTVCDFHAEATSEKLALARYLDGSVSLVVGTHTHVQTADEQILPKGTAFITDLGMCGSNAGVIGMDAGVALGRFLSGVPEHYRIAEKELMINGIAAEVDAETGKALRIERLRWFV